MGDGLQVRTRIQLVFMEMPEMCITRDQLRRLLGLSTDACDRALSALLQSGFLIESIDGVLARAATASPLARAKRPSDDAMNL